MPEETVQLNQIVPDFTADATGQPFRLSDYKGTNLVIYFYPKDNTPGCTAESIDFRDHYVEFQQAGTEIVGVSRDSLRSHENFARKFDLPFTLISDPEETLCNRFNVMKTKTRYGKVGRGIERSTFLIDRNGQLVKEWRGVKVPGHIEEILEAARQLNR